MAKDKKLENRARGEQHQFLMQDRSVLVVVKLIHGVRRISKIH